VASEERADVWQMRSQYAHGLDQESVALSLDHPPGEKEKTSSPDTILRRGARIPGSGRIVLDVDSVRDYADVGSPAHRFGRICRRGADRNRPVSFPNDPSNEGLEPRPVTVAKRIDLCSIDRNQQTPA